MSRTVAAPGSSIAAQLREERAKLRRAARKKIEAAKAEYRDAAAAWEAAERVLLDKIAQAELDSRELEDRLRGRTPEITFTEGEEGAQGKE